MALETLAEGNKYSSTQLQAGVVQEIITESPMLELLPFDTILGNSLTYNRELTLGTAQFYDPGDTWVESTPTITPVIATLKILGGDADVDDFIAQTRANIQDVQALALSLKAKALARTLQKEIIYGDKDDIDPKGFDGLHEILGIVTGAQDVRAGTTTTGGPGSLSQLDELADLVKPGPPDCYMMHKRTRRGIQTLARSQGWVLPLSQPQGISRPLMFYNDIPILINDHITITEDCIDGGFGGMTGDDTTSIFAIKFGGEGLHGIDSGAGVQVDPIGALETKDATRHRIKWYCSQVLMSTCAVARYSGIDDQAWGN